MIKIRKAYRYSYRFEIVKNIFLELRSSGEKYFFNLYEKLTRNKKFMHNCVGYKTVFYCPKTVRFATRYGDTYF